jgi:dTDP-4-dehydrorhamnose reductase
VRLLILGGSGMLGHRLLAHFERRGHEVRATLQRSPVDYGAGQLLRPDNTISGLDLRNPAALERAFAYDPEAVVNAAGMVLQRSDASDPILNIELNSLLPQRAAARCRARGIRFIHISTDCVFSGTRGGYTEADVPDPVDLYGRSKLLGETTDSPGITLRTSMIGPEIVHRHGLVEWFLAQQGPIRGFRRAIFSGLTTTEMCQVVERLLRKETLSQGLYHVSADPISKYDLLCALRDALGRSMEIIPVDEPVVDRSLDSSRFRREIGYNPPGWPEMIAALAAEIREAGT